MTSINVTPVEIMAGLGALLVLVMVWRSGACQARSGRCRAGRCALDVTDRTGAVQRRTDRRGAVGGDHLSGQPLVPACVLGLPAMFASYPWVRRAKWFTVAATYVMNTWASYTAGSASAVVLHSVPPLVMFVAVEAITDLRDKLTEAVTAAYTEAVTAVPERRRLRVRPDRQPTRQRKLLGEYLADAGAELPQESRSGGAGRQGSARRDPAVPAALPGRGGAGAGGRRRVVASLGDRARLPRRRRTGRETGGQVGRDFEH